ncbi:hypothetical protein CSUNSWCD_1749 [Campylobacter showae CSUNSWCD]|uniref:Uncharacterized protein n=1 Tax=Campylobacter showae CSUNSWCD TaxID=1244083 RepID=M5IRC3_9BACT|nr:hypothetical protein CSUNSWCD_1749 [Campylobacter showae CSUNSWCD]
MLFSFAGTQNSKPKNNISKTKAASPPRSKILSAAKNRAKMPTQKAIKPGYPAAAARHSFCLFLVNINACERVICSLLIKIYVNFDRVRLKIK